MPSLSLRSKRRANKAKMFQDFLSKWSNNTPINTTISMIIRKLLVKFKEMSDKKIILWGISGTIWAT